MDRQITERQIQFTADTILIVDDSELNRAILKEIFKDSYEIMEAENGQECLEKTSGKQRPYLRRSFWM